MGNMSYCRFSNTLSDLSDCYEVMDEVPRSEEERKARVALIKLCRSIAADYTDEDGDIR